MSNKDFLSQFSDENKKPASFKEEERIPITKKPFNYKPLIAGLLILGVIAGVAAFFILRPTIPVPDFTGQNKNEVSAWVKQQGIETSGIRALEEYSLDFAKDTIISQSIEGGKKVKKDVKFTFTISLGPDPGEAVAFPDIKTMVRDEIDRWIADNQLLNTKVTTVYSDTVAKDQVINYELKNADEATFKRGSTLNIAISKGPQPAKTITLEDFSKKSLYEVEEWAKNNKLTLKKVEVFSDTVASGLIASQSPAAKSQIKEGETLTVYVSKGKGLTVPNFTAMSESDFNNWREINGDFPLSLNKKVYSSASQYILEQSVAPGKVIGMDEKVSLKVNLGDGFYLADENMPLENSSLDRLKDWAEEVKTKGITIYVEVTEVQTAQPRGMIVSHRLLNGDRYYSDIEKLPLELRVQVEVSTGTPAPTTVTVEPFYLTDEDMETFTQYKDHVVDWFAAKNAAGYSLQYELQPGTTDPAKTGFVESYTISDTAGNPLNINSKLPVDAKFIFRIYQ